MKSLSKKLSKNNSPEKPGDVANDDTVSRQCLKPKQFKYQPEKQLKFQKRIKMSEKQHIPIRTLVEKISSAPELAHLNQDDKLNMIMAQIQFHTANKSQVDMNFKKFITPRDTTYVAKPFMFDRYNYENYENYQYKNPFKPAKYSIEDRVIKPPPKLLNKGSSKNLQVVFCEQKFQQFVGKANKQMNEYYQQNRTKSISNLSAKTLSNLMQRSRSTSTNFNTTTRSSKNRSKSLRNSKAPRRISTLSNYLQQFNTLQKLSQYMEREHKLNEKFLFTSTMADKSNTVLIEILIHRFQFLKKMKKKCQQLIFKILFNLEQLPQYYKINIQDYLKFIQLFISRDADSFGLSMFIFSFLFKEEQQISEQVARKTMGLLGGSANLHYQVQNRILLYVQKSDGNGQRVFQFIKNDEVLQKLFVDLLLQP